MTRPFADQRSGDFAAGAAVAVACAAAIAGAATPAIAQQRDGSGVRSADVTEITAFRLTGVEGYVYGSYWSDTDERPGATGQPSTTTLSNITAKAFVMTHSYVYHPNLLLLDLGLGPVFFRNDYSSEGAEGRSRRTELDVSTRATFLRDKPYRGSVFYDQLNDSQAAGPAQSLLTTSTRYGFDFALLPPVSRLPFYFDASRFQSKGSGTDQILDEDIREASLRTERSWGAAGNTTLRVQAIDDDSKSGSRGLPIQQTTSRNQRVDLDTSLAFGEQRADTLTNTVSYNAIDFTSNAATIADNRLFRFDLSYRGLPSAALQTRLRYQFDQSDQTALNAGPQSIRLNAVNAGLTWQASEDLGVTLDALGSRNRGSAFDADVIGAGGSVNYRRALALGEFATTYYANLGRRDQVAQEPFVAVVGERQVLVGLTWSALRRSSVVPGSVVVQNATRSQTYIEGIDYALREIGLVTEIQRLVAGAIVDGQEVLVDYRFDSGGTYSVIERNQSLDLAWRYEQAFSVYLRLADASPRLTSGTPTTPLNPSTSVLVGTRADLPFEFAGEQLTAGGLVEWTDRRDAVSPAKRTLVEAYIASTIPLIARGGLRLGVRQQATAYELTPLQDVTQQTYTVRLWSRFRSGLEITLDGTSSRDTGSPLVERSYRQLSAKADWRIRQMTLSLRYDNTKQMQNDFTQIQSRTLFELRRTF